jgi:branched-chain amino acid transport system substrate-binding protein
MYVQYRGVAGTGLEEWRKAGREVVLFPPQYKNGTIVTPYEGNRR